MSLTPQQGILPAVPAHGRYAAFDFILQAPNDPGTLGTTLKALVKWHAAHDAVVALGPQVCEAFKANIPGLRPFEGIAGSLVDLPTTPQAVWVWLRGDAPGDLLLAQRVLQAVLAPAFVLAESHAGFKHGEGRDLTGYEDGTENPEGDDAVTAALVQTGGKGLPGGSFVSVQRWQHDLARFDAMTRQQQDHMIGRRRSNNKELARAPESAHVKRTAQENFEPEAFVVRRSMPWIEGSDCGLMFVAFAATLDAFEAQLRRMSGAEDGIVDAMFGMSQPVSGLHAWCPPLRAGKLDLRALGL